MADEPISALTQISPPPFSTAFTNPTTGAVLEILDTTNTSMASSGTNSKIAPGDLIKGFLAAGTNVTLTETAGIVTIAASGGGGMTNPMTTAGDEIIGGSSGTPARLAIGTNGQVHMVVAGAPAWANPVTETSAQAVLASNYATSYSASTLVTVPSFSISLPTAGTYLVSANIHGYVSSGTTSAVGVQIWVQAQLYDNTLGSAIIGGAASTAFGTLQVASTIINFQSYTTLGPVFYTVSGATTIVVQAASNSTGAVSTDISSQYVLSGSTISSIRLY